MVSGLSSPSFHLERMRRRKYIFSQQLMFYDCNLKINKLGFLQKSEMEESGTVVYFLETLDLDFF